VVAERLRLAGRIIGFGVTGFGGMMVIGEASMEFTQKGWAAIIPTTPADPGLLLMIIGAVALAACILSWWRERAAGIMLVSAAAAMGIGIFAIGAPGRLVPWLIVGLPLLVAGVLFLNSWRLSRELA